MKKFYSIAIAGFLMMAIQSGLFAQNSVLINLGSKSCDSSKAGFFLVKDPFTNTPSSLAACDLSAQLPDYYNVFVAFNPKNSKVYIADIRTGATQIWVMDVGLPGSIGCPASIPVKADYSYSYVSNNFEFDNNGDLWSISSYNPNTGLGSIDKFDVNTGNIINTRVVKFPTGFFPTAITSGDICILPNGRMFATLGSFPSRLYEINNYSGTDTAYATYLQQMPSNTFGIAYINGSLEVTGISNTCYYYEYNIAKDSLSPAKAFQNGLAPIDNSSFSPAIGAAKQLVNTTKVDNNTYDLSYEIYVTNMGNTFLNDVNVTEDLGKVFGANNISNVTAGFVSGSNNAGLILNPQYNGTTVTQLLTAGQQLANKRSDNNDYSFKINVAFRATQITPGVLYNNTALATATINTILSPITISDSSNNGDETMVDPNKDGNATTPDENIPTPFNTALLPVKFINMQATLTNKRTGMITWSVATPVNNAKYFEPQYSTDGNNWNMLSQIAITNNNKSTYQYEHIGLPSGKIYYRVKQADNDGTVIYSRIAALQVNSGTSYNIYPNPAKSAVTISGDNLYNTTVIINDATGRIMGRVKMTGNSQTINTSSLRDGTYFVQFVTSEKTISRKLVVKH